MYIKMSCDLGSCIPVRAHKTDAGLDLYAMEGGWILPFGRKTFDTGVHVQIPENHVGLLTSKSGLMQKGITSRGTIDCGYTGSIKAVLLTIAGGSFGSGQGRKSPSLRFCPLSLLNRTSWKVWSRPSVAKAVLAAPGNSKGVTAWTI